MKECRFLYQYYNETYYKNSGIAFQSRKSPSNNLFIQEHCILVILFLKPTFFIPYFHGRCKSVVFSFCLFPSLNVAFFVFYAKDQLQLLWCLVITKRCITLETAKELKTIISPSKINCLMLQTFRMFSILIICLQRFYLAQDFYYAKINTTHFHSLSIKIKPFYTISHRTPFRTPIMVFRIFFDFQFHIFFD